MAITWQSTHKTGRWMEKTRRWEKGKKVGEHQISDQCIGQFQSSSKNATDKWTFEKSLCVWHCKNIGLLSGEVCGSVRWVSASLEGEITIENTLEETDRVARSQIEVQRDQCWFMAILFSIFCYRSWVFDRNLFIIWGIHLDSHICLLFTRAAAFICHEGQKDSSPVLSSSETEALTLKTTFNTYRAS